MAEPNGNYIEHCHWLLALPPSVTSTHSFSSRSWRVILSGYANCDRRSEREPYRTLSLAACASAKCHDHPFVQQPSRTRNSFGVRKLTAEPNANYTEHCHWLLALPLSVTSTHSLSSRPGRVILSGYANCDGRAERELYRTLSLAACASATCHLHPFAQQSFRARNSFGVGKL